MCPYAYTRALFRILNIKEGHHKGRKSLARKYLDVQGSFQTQIRRCFQSDRALQMRENNSFKICRKEVESWELS